MAIPEQQSFRLSPLQAAGTDAGRSSCNPGGVAPRPSFDLQILLDECPEARQSHFETVGRLVVGVDVPAVVVVEVVVVAAGQQAAP